ncbi:LLM class flavin-dependent oxidoreductase [Actinomadura barringtoniae]|uniref:LLM class flavin-dependent oxidoreductase n=1 Tax=Actinomadura barringtoniae TaxID=1427535 RepID=A0A939T9C9_9ACTN|nr:LLM class flavin-dependent oxidoreductase [Actinomadura barringtoniae]MBO2447850.1 LLM class flavin-dependent oxidoreductase [Actinomadura barringtoniae]
MRITYGPWGETLGELVAAARAAEEAGAEALWVPELHRSATVAAAAVAQGTRRARIGTAITLAFTRSPMVTALEALDLDELSGGRFVLGLGSGVRRLNEDWHNVRWGSPVAHLRESVAAVRHIVAHAVDGAPMVLDGAHESLAVRGFRRPFPQARAEIPIYLAGLGPAMTRLAGQIGDGWISHELCSPEWLRERALPALEDGLGAAGREREALDVVVSAVCSLDPDPVVARGRAAGVAGFYASVRSYADFFAFHGLADDQAWTITALRSGAGADDLASAVSGRMVDALTVTGTAERVRDRLAAYEGVADTLKLTPPVYGLPAAETRAAQARLIELIRELT